VQFTIRVSKIIVSAMMYSCLNFGDLFSVVFFWVKFLSILVSHPIVITGVIMDLIFK